MESPACVVCRSNSGTTRISPGPPIYHGRWWRVEHAYPTALRGWLVIVLERHAEALHDLTESEALEPGRLQRAVARLLVAHFDCPKEYSRSLGEAPGFGHLHFHVVPRATDLDEALRGCRIFGSLIVPADQVVPPEEVAGLCRRLRSALRDSDVVS